MSYGGRTPYLIQSDGVDLNALDNEEGQMYHIPEKIINAFLYQILLDNRTDDLIERLTKGKEIYAHRYEQDESEYVQELLMRSKTNDELIQYYIVNSELNMSVGKIAGQVSHVATNIANLCHNMNNFKRWFHNGQKKIILRGKEKDLLKLKEQGFHYILDNGLTEIPKDSLTCVGLGVMWKSEAQQYVKRLQLL